MVPYHRARRGGYQVWYGTIPTIPRPMIPYHDLHTVEGKQLRGLPRSHLALAELFLIIRIFM